MRIIGGQFGGLRFDPPATKWPTRPTTDFAKEGLYNVLTNRIDFESMIFLDLFGGTGSHCYETISRGCQDATYVDQHKGCVEFVEKMRDKLGIEKQLKILRRSVFKHIKLDVKSYSYIFAGPPYPLKSIPTIPNLIFESTLLSEEGLFIMEHNSEWNFESHANFTEVKKYSGTYFSFFKHVK